MSQWFAIIDGAADARLYDLISKTRNHACLYTGDYDAETRKALPYVVEMRNGETFSQTWSQHESGRSWGILCRTSLTLTNLRRHLRHFTTARLPDGQVVMFRFWDPRVFKTFVEEGEENEVAPIFKGIELIVADYGVKGRRHYKWQDGLRFSDTANSPANVSA